MSDEAKVISFELETAKRRPKAFPRPRFLPTVNGTVILTLGTGRDAVEEHLDVRAARALLNELADAVDAAEHLARVGTEVADG